ncbi:hypothetical protein ACFWFF_07965 [Streptomyces sp. NPDC060223]|uniref:hypothetical protein n=1 Tax=Streptomyces sp. NPDC060223 TaxID=3347077 RepID=UPI0036594FF1
MKEPEEQFEERIGTVLRQAGESYETDRGALLAAGEERGRRLLLRRKAAVMGGVAGVALVGLGAALLVPGGGEGGGRSVAASAGASTSIAGTPAGAISGDELVRTLEKLLPEGEFSGRQSRGTDELLGPYAEVVYDDGQGKAAVTVSLGRLAPDGEQSAQAVECPDKALSPYDSCATSRLADGSALTLFKGYEYPDRRVDTKLWTAYLVTPQGQHVTVNEWNAPAEKGAPVSRDEPPLSAAQLEALVTATEWRTAIDAIPDDPKTPTGTPEAPPAGIDSEAIRSTLVSLLPEDVEVVGKGGQDTGFAYVVVDDGQGESLIQINVQPDMSDVEGQLFGPDAEVLPDGTKVVTRQGPGEKGGSGVVMWTADTIRPDGGRVVVSAFNSGGQESDATREAPAVTIEQLKAIATSPKWLTVG